MATLNLRDRFEDGELDLSMSDLEEVPVKEIIAIKKAKALDLSNNRLTKLGKNFATITQIVKLDLGKNLLTELPENFGDMRQLRHLDLYSNKIDRLPLSFGRLSNLRWLDLKGNPLVPKLAEVAGPCLDAAECAKCARSVVALLHNMAVAIEEEKARREQQKQIELQKQIAALNASVQNNKKENKIKKKSKAENSDKIKKGANASDLKNSRQNEKRKNGSGLKMKPTKDQKKGRGLAICVYFLIFIIIMLSLAGLALFFVDEKLFWNYAQATSIFFEESVASASAWWESKGLRGVKDWAGGGLTAFEAAKHTVFNLYNSMSNQSRVYVESFKNLF